MGKKGEGMCAYHELVIEGTPVACTTDGHDH